MLNISRLFSTVIVLYPLLSIYGVGIASVTLADACLLMCYPLLFFLKVKRKELSFLFFFFLFYVCVQYIFSSLSIAGSNDMLWRTMRYSLYLFTLFILKRYFTFEYAYKLYGILAVFATIFLLVQFIVFHATGIYVPGYLPVFPVLRDELLEFASYVGSDGGDIRMRSIFGEPAHYAQYVLGYMVLLLFQKKGRMKLLLLSSGILLSGSTIGICLMLFVFLIWCCHEKTNTRKWLLLGGGALGIIVLFVGIEKLMLISDTWFGVNPFLKFTSENIGSGRLGSYEILYSLNMSGSDLLFGHGMETSFPIYLPGFLMLFWYFGLMGLFIYIAINVYLYVKSGFVARLLILVFALLNIGSEAALGPFLLLYFAFILVDEKSYNTIKCHCVYENTTSY